MTLFLAFHVFCFVCFQEQNLHFAPFCLSSLVANSYFFNSKYPLLAPKTLLFNGYFAFSSDVFHGFKRFCFIQLLWMFMLFVSHLAANRTTFSSILPCV